MTKLSTISGFATLALGLLPMIALVITPNAQALFGL